MAHACNPRPWEAETGELPCLKKTKAKRKRFQLASEMNMYLVRKRKKKKRKMEKRVGTTLVRKTCSGKSKGLRRQRPLV